MSFSPGERVTRKSHNHDLLFRISSITGDTAILHGEDVRLAADAPLDDLVYVKEKDLAVRKQKEKEQVEFSYRLFSQDYRLMKEKREYESGDGYQHTAGFFQLPARVLHVDGDRTYLRKCMELYKRVGLEVHGVHMLEKEMPGEIGALVDEVDPHIIVITGHDAFSRNKGRKNDLRAYRHSKYFIETVEIIRQKNPRLDELVIFAGACQSHFESLIRAGANFASSPSRINIHALDPVYIAAKVAYTPFMEKISIWNLLRNTLTGEKGLGGVETKGLLRMGMPLAPENENDDQSI
ncbi:sporulation peptidase YabG [Lentibacillus amyloliquefaciens]|uniref:Sporulation peptidase YabG n=1 Tax=Lentibacillus amyloliquefaciens TaxID=1472767 RepID=A0A0U4DVP3_9BACI|nr:sporulation peptidase YabG [Lentibacillus amyloliquefaciens]ALX49448.1 sporulation peptidase YabG [Lentibacillus amyloliquefaciens]